MTFIISPKSIQNTKGTTAKFGGGGSVNIGGDFQNIGDVRVDVRAKLSVIGNVINTGSFHIKDHVAKKQYKLIENAIADSDGQARKYLQNFDKHLKDKKFVKAKKGFGKFFIYIKHHPELITDSIQALLQLFLKKG
ncbi:MAG: hypothetical protein U9N54_09555 [candidate division Zixibacteria bacterium]|nr:hypothetical protein [candidate division Zixibacteria bacterium]